MSWKRESAQVGLGGLTPREAATGAMCLEEFQRIPEPPEPLFKVNHE